MTVCAIAPYLTKASAYAPAREQLILSLNSFVPPDTAHDRIRSGKFD